MLTHEQLAECKSLLQERQARLIQQVEDHFGKTYEFIKESTGELSNYDNHPADHGTELFERGKDVALNEHAEAELEDINKALHAIADGAYGICVDCGRDIPFERLQAVPTADKCIEHANQTVFENNRPVEEGVFSPNINPDDTTPETQAAYDAEDAWQDVARYGTSESPSDFYGDRADYNNMYPNDDEEIGGTEAPENFLAADREGRFTGVTPNHKKYEAEYDRYRND
ncbi:TraR/DksA C4-type zinc finger protein [Lentibacillus saliphilus]|uniref:TraR/DksA C4-type zinc finger protein n=1 Tax=Lentibacillus saliphilus TaxID=2737028 RepID=UPI001C306889|nr:TraR/DksA C4-type zinc finger protein [Lentibacillus saliphilus]